MRFSIREMLAAALFVAAACASFAGSKPPAWIVAATTSAIAVLFAAIVIRGAVLSGRPRAFTLGFLIPASAYLLCTFSIGETEFSSRSEGRMPTTQFMQSQLSPKAVSSEAARQRIRNAKTLMPLGHLLTALLLGYAGGKYATWLYCRNVSERAGN